VLPSARESERLRVFIALDAPESVRAALADAQAKCMERVPGAAVKWTRPEQFHLTLRFLGHIERTIVNELTARLRKAGAALRALDLNCAGLGLFPERGRPRVLWAGVNDATSSGLRRTFKGIADTTKGVGHEEAEKEFTGHITLARCKDVGRTEADRLKELVGQYSQHAFGSWRAVEILVMQSALSPKGAQYSVLERIPLGKS
jgi:2'-5' RNA ligase